MDKKTQPILKFWLKISQMHHSYSHCIVFASSVCSAWPVCSSDICVSGTLTLYNILPKYHSFRRDYLDILIKISSVPSHYPPLPYFKLLYRFMITWYIICLFLCAWSPFTRIIRASRIEMAHSLFTDMHRLCLEQFLERCSITINVYLVIIGWNKERELCEKFYMYFYTFSKRCFSNFPQVK